MLLKSYNRYEIDKRPSKNLNQLSTQSIIALFLFHSNSKKENVMTSQEGVFASSSDLKFFYAKSCFVSRKRDILLQLVHSRWVRLCLVPGTWVWLGLSVQHSIFNLFQIMDQFSFLIHLTFSLLRVWMFLLKFSYKNSSVKFYAFLRQKGGAQDRKYSIVDVILDLSRL